jgi:hypothetical protein
MADQVNAGGVALTAVVIAMVWLGLSVAGAAGIVLFGRLKIMWGTGHGWKDAGVLMRNRQRRGLHARIDRDRPITRAPRIPATMMQPVSFADDDPEPIGYSPTQTMATIKITAVDGDGS